MALMWVKLECCICIQGRLGMAKQHHILEFVVCSVCSELVYPLRMWDKVRVCWLSRKVSVGCHLILSLLLHASVNKSIKKYETSSWKTHLILIQFCVYVELVDFHILTTKFDKKQRFLYFKRPKIVISISKRQRKLQTQHLILPPKNAPSIQYTDKIKGNLVLTKYVTSFVCK